MKIENKKNIKQKNILVRGVISAYLLIAISISVTIITGLLVFVTTNHRQSTNEVSSQQALQIAESGIYYYRWYLAHSLDGKNALQIRDFWENGDPVGVDAPFEQDVTDFSGSAVGRYRLEIEAPNPDSTIVIAVSTGWTYKDPHITKSVKVRFRRPSWSEYSVLANDIMRFGAGTTVYGPIHSNNGIRFDGVANNVVSSSVASYYDPDTNSTKPGVWTSLTNENEVFLAGKEFPVPAIDFNGVTTDLSLMRTEAQTDGLYLGGGTYDRETCSWKHTGPGWWGWAWVCETEQIPIKGYHLTLRTDDIVEVRKVIDAGISSFGILDETSAENFNFPSNGLIYVDNYLWVDGQIDEAKLTIVSAQLDTAVDTNIYINNDLLYTNKDGSDVIGLIAENNILVGYYSENDLEIDAALLAQKGKVGRNHYSSGSYATRNQITVYGSIATNQRYGFAWTDGTGYQIRNLYFDNNLLYSPPPYFPTGTTYELDLWEDL